MFFKLKQDSIKKNKITRYFIYAFGEVIIVIVGVLLAISFNNYNTSTNNNSQADLMKKYEFINLYGFMSTTQFNFIENKNIIHHFIINNEKRVKEGIKLLDNKKIYIHKI